MYLAFVALFLRWKKPKTLRYSKRTLTLPIKILISMNLNEREILHANKSYYFLTQLHLQTGKILTLGVGSGVGIESNVVGSTLGVHIQS